MVKSPWWNSGRKVLKISNNFRVVLFKIVTSPCEFLKTPFYKKAPAGVKEAEYNFREFVLAPTIFYGKAEGMNAGFYMEKDSCTSCGAPEAEAPDLIEHAKGTGECFFKKQPETEEEVRRAINAVLVSCVDALRYGGRDEAILKKMYERGLSGNCDYKPAGSYQMVVRNVVVFDLDGEFKELVNHISTGLAVKSLLKVIDFWSTKPTGFNFVLRWAHSYSGVFFSGNLVKEGSYKIVLLQENGDVGESIISMADELHDVLASLSAVSNIMWYEDGKEGNNGLHRPW